MKHCETKQLETERLILRKFRMEDAPAMYENWASDDEVTKYLAWPIHTCLKVTQAVIGDWVNSYLDEKYYQWVITIKEKEGVPIGSIAAVIVKDEISMVQIGYSIAKNW